MVTGALLLTAWLAHAGAAPQAGTGASSIAVRVVGAGAPMILIPGFVSSGDVWNGVVDHYKNRYQCHIVTIAGFAGVPPADPISLKRVRDDIVAYAAAKNLRKPVIVGHSLGGMLALWIAETQPDLPGAIVSVDGVPFLPGLMNAEATADSARAQADQMQTLYASLTPAQLAAQSRLAFGSMISDAARVDEATGWAEHSDPHTAAVLIHDLMTTDIRSDVGRIRAPVLLIPAVKAMAASPEMVKTALAAYGKQIAAAPAHEIVPAETLHFVMLDDPGFLLKTMDGFLARQLAGVH